MTASDYRENRASRAPTPEWLATLEEVLVIIAAALAVTPGDLISDIPSSKQEHPA